MMLAYKKSTTKGFTIIEVMIAMALSSAVLAAVYQTFHSQQRSYTMQSEAATMAQNLRGSLYLLTRELRSAGYNPTQATTDNFRFVTSFAAPNDLFIVNYAIDHAVVAFTSDTDGNGVIASNSNEQIAYRFNEAQKTLERFNDAQVDAAKKWEIVASNIEAVYFTYFDQNNTITTNQADIEYVAISLLARMAKQDSKYKDDRIVYCLEDGFIKTKCDTSPIVPLCPPTTCPDGYFGDHYHRRLLTTKIQIRNKLVTPS